MDLLDRETFICSDSQSALSANASVKISSALVKNCKTALNRLAELVPLILVCVSGYYDILGNESSDELARNGFLTNFTG